MRQLTLIFMITGMVLVVMEDGNEQEVYGAAGTVRAFGMGKLVSSGKAAARKLTHARILLQAVMDNLKTHHESSLYEAFTPREARRLIDKLDIIYTPKHGSWLNIAEIELAS